MFLPLYIRAEIGEGDDFFSLSLHQIRTANDDGGSSSSRSSFLSFHAIILPCLRLSLLIARLLFCHGSGELMERERERDAAADLGDQRGEEH